MKYRISYEEVISEEEIKEFMDDEDATIQDYLWQGLQIEGGDFNIELLPDEDFE